MTRRHTSSKRSGYNACYVTDVLRSRSCLMQLLGRHVQRLADQHASFVVVFVFAGALHMEAALTLYLVCCALCGHPCWEQGPRHMYLPGASLFAGPRAQALAACHVLNIT
jgi:hypothetical protein